MSLHALLRSLVHCVLLAILGVVSVIIASVVSQAMIGLPQMEPPSNALQILFIIAAIEASALYCLALRLIGPNWRRFIILFAVYHTTKWALMLVEAALYLNVWNKPPLISLKSILAYEVLGLLASALVCVGATLVTPSKCQKVIGLKFDVRKIMAISVLYAACYLLAGAFIFIPLAGDSYEATYQALNVAWWMPVLQLARGAIWACLLWVLVANMQGTKRLNCLIVGLSLAIFGAAQLMMPNSFMLEEVRDAHILEIALSMFVFGYLAVTLLLHRHPV